MKINIFLLLILSANATCCQTTTSYDKKIVEEVRRASVLEAPFMLDELIEIYKKDPLIIKKSFNKEVFERTEYTRYCYNICADFFKSKLLEKKNNGNTEVIQKIISELDYKDNIVKPTIDWARVFATCQTCSFGEYPDERFFYFKFSVMYMGEKEIKQMINSEGGKQWKYALMAIREGDAFSLNKEEGYYKQYVLDRRIATYIIEKWKDSEIPEVQELIAIYKSIM